MKNVGIIGSGFYVPSKVMTNREIAKMVNTTEEWIYDKVGIKERRIAAPQEATSDLAIYAALEAMRNANVHAEDIDLIILATSTPDMIQPATASIVQGKLGALNSAAFDVSAVCAGFVYALTVAYGMMKGISSYKKVLVIGAETYSRILDWNDRSTCVFFGDGAGAVILGEVEEGLGIQTSFLRNDGRGASVIKFLAGGSRYPASIETLEKNMHRFEMQGKQVWDFATTVCPQAVTKVVEEAGEEVENLDLVITHQANINIIKKSMEKLGLPMSKTYTNIEHYGNTSGASVAIALAEAHQKGILKKNDKLALVGFGGGLAYGAIYMNWAL
ncbi:MAG TPA: ketoacyl-ACP synthase III [Epulopiscium sp.]|nr:ketoacyl-ACP synthase III [Candidatus Epulonipiscium sp.]